jgi:TonB family protein
MSREYFVEKHHGLRKAGMRLLQASVLALTASFALLGNAAEERAIKSRVAPVYPELAKRMRITGVVKLAVTVNAEGSVTDVKPESGNQALSVAAQDAVRKWRFAPGAGQTTFDVSVNFTLDQ